MNSPTISPVRAAFVRMGAYLAAYEAGDTNALDELDRVDLSLASAVEEETLFLENLDAQLERAAQAIKIAKERVKALENLRERVGNNLLADMNLHGLEEVEGLTRKMVAQRNGGVSPILYGFALGTIANVIPDDVLGCIPMKYFKLISAYVLDKEAVAADLRAGVVLPFATVLPRGRHLAFKPL